MNAARQPETNDTSHVCGAYVDGVYCEKTGGTWHLEDAPFKAEQVTRMLRRHPDIGVQSVCDIGCGAGGVLVELSAGMSSASMVGYEPSPQAHALSLRLENPHCEFVLGDAFQDGRRFDVALALDVVEHVEDCFAFLRACAGKARWKIYHIPLDASASLVLRGVNCWDSVGHLHLFTLETAIKTVEHSGQRISDWFLTPVSLSRPHRPATRLTNIPRRVLPARLAARVLGGYSVMILAE